MTPRAKPEQDTPDGPAKIKAGHVQDQLTSPIAGAPKAWRNRNEHPIEAALRSEKISNDEAVAGDAYRVFWELRENTGETKFEIIGSRSSSGADWTQHKVNATRSLQAIEAELQKFEDGGRWIIIVQKFCGEGWTAADAVRAAGFTNANRTWERIRLALSKLSSAISRSGVDLTIVRDRLD